MPPYCPNHISNRSGSRWVGGSALGGSQEGLGNALARFVPDAAPYQSPSRFAYELTAIWHIWGITEEVDWFRLTLPGIQAPSIIIPPVGMIRGR